jgi:hypothetical protein
VRPRRKTDVYGAPERVKMDRTTIYIEGGFTP